MSLETGDITKNNGINYERYPNDIYRFCSFVNNFFNLPFFIYKTTILDIIFRFIRFYFYSICYGSFVIKNFFYEKISLFVINCKNDKLKKLLKNDKILRKRAFLVITPK